MDPTAPLGQTGLSSINNNNNPAAIGGERGDLILNLVRMPVGSVRRVRCSLRICAISIAACFAATHTNLGCAKRRII